VRQEYVKQIFQIVRPRHARSEFLQQCLEVFFRRLLAMEADGVNQDTAPAMCGEP
jgi:hypothetical protein